jgi:hypothetical protein
MAVNSNVVARGVNIALGLWLFLSAFVWPHTTAQMTNTWIVGLLVVAFAAISLRVPQARWVNTALAVWLFISVWALPTTVPTFWNNLIIAVAVFIVSLVPGVPGGPPTRMGRGRSVRHEPPPQRPAAPA